MAHLVNDNAGVQGELTENRNLALTKRGKARLFLICSTNTNCDNMAYRSFRSEKGSARDVRADAAGLAGLWQPRDRSGIAF